MNQDSHWTHAEIKRNADEAWESGYKSGLVAGLSEGWSLAYTSRSIKTVRDTLRAKLDELKNN